MQQEDDLRGLTKTMEFMRAISILFVVIYQAHHIHFLFFSDLEHVSIHRQLYLLYSTLFLLHSFVFRSLSFYIAVNSP